MSKKRQEVLGSPKRRLGGSGGCGERVGGGVQSLRGTAVLSNSKGWGVVVVRGWVWWLASRMDSRTWGCEEDQPGPVSVLIISLRMLGTSPAVGSLSGVECGGMSCYH